MRWTRQRTDTMAAPLAPTRPLAATDGDDILDGDDGPNLIDGGGGDDFLDGKGGDDTLHGGEGDDVLIGGPGSDELNGGPGDDYISAEGFGDAPGIDFVAGGGGRDRLYFGSFDGMIGDTVTDFGSDDFLQAEGEIRAHHLSVMPDRAVFAIDVDGDGTAEGSFTLLGDFRGGAFSYEGQVFGATDLRFHPFLPNLAETRALSAEAVNGMYGPFAFQTLSGLSDHLVRPRTDIGESTFANVLGIYRVEFGKITDVKILVTDTRSDDREIDLDEADYLTLGEIGFFVVSDGAAWAQGLAAGDSLSFIDSRDGSVAEVTDGAHVALAVNGTAAADLTVFHSLDASLNPDGLTHVVSGIAPGDAPSGNNLTRFVGFEDQLGGGDRDYQDVVFEFVEDLSPFV